MAVVRTRVAHAARYASLPAWAAVAASSNDPTFPPLEDIVAHITARQPEPPMAIIVLAGLFAFTMVVGWHGVGHLVTVSHEGGHALLALLLGAGVRRVVISTDGTGFTEPRQAGASPFLVAFAGYLAPPLFGLGGAAVLATDHPTALLWIAVALLAALLFTVRNPFGWFVIVLAGGVLFLVAAYATPTVHALVAYVSVWFLLMAGFPHLTSFRLARTKDSDFQKMRDMTWVPGLVWMVLQLGLAGLAFFYGARMLLDL